MARPPAADSVEHGIPVVRLRVSGTFDMSALPRIQHAVDEVLAVNPHVLLLDLSDCSHIDAAGIGLLLELHRRMRRNGGRLTVDAATEEVQWLLHLARVDQVLDVRAAGVESVRAARRRTAVPVTMATLNGELL